MTNQVATSHESVCAGTITAGYVRAEMASSMIRCLNEGAVRFWFVQPCGPYLDMGRNKICRRFLNYDGYLHEGETLHDEEFLYMWDADVKCNPEQLIMLVEAARKYHAEHGVWPVIGGAYLGIHGGTQDVIAYRWHETGEVVRDLPVRDLHTIDYDEVMGHEDPAQVDALGTGSMLIHRSILETMARTFAEPQPWFIEGPLRGIESNVQPYEGVGPAPVGVWFGEDIFFCFRAAQLGHPILLHRGVRLVHYKDLGLSFKE